MKGFSKNSLQNILKQIRLQAKASDIRITQHAQQKMTEESILLDDVLYTIGNGKIVENYPDHKRGPCCLLWGTTKVGRPVHIVCTTSQPLLIIITVYEPKPPKWITPIERGR